MHALVNFIPVSVGSGGDVCLAIAIVLESERLSKSDYPRPPTFSTGPLTRERSRFWYTPRPSFRENCLNFKIAWNSMLEFDGGIVIFLFFSFFKICDQSISCFDYVLKKRKEGLKSWFLENRDVFWRIRVIFFWKYRGSTFFIFRARYFCQKIQMYIYIFDSTRIYEASLWHGSKCIEWFLLPT